MAIARCFVPSLNRSLSRFMAAASSSQPDSHIAGLDLFERLGGNCIYLHGEGGETHSREATGRWLRERRRADFFLATQICHDDWDEAASKPINRFTSAAVAEDIGTDLELLGADHLDLVCLGDQPALSFEPILTALASEIAVVRIGTYALSSWSADRAQAAIEFARKNKLPSPAALQTTELALLRATAPLWPEYPAFDSRLKQVARDNSLAVFAHVEDFNLGLSLFDPNLSTHWRLDWKHRWNQPANAVIKERVEALATAQNLTPREINLACVLSSPFPVVGIISLPTLLADSGSEFEHASVLADDRSFHFSKES
jgi:aryl-alcohol dehydrogenase-like predicted oxidoreductase